MSNQTKMPPYQDEPTHFAQMQFALQAAGVGTWDLNLTNQTVWWDARCKELYGFRADDIVPYQQVLSYMHPDDRAQVDEAVGWALNPESQGRYDIEFRTIGAQDDQLRWLRCQGQAYFDEQGIAYRFSGIAQDITVQKLIGQSLLGVETKYQNLFNALDDGFCTIQVTFDEHQQPIDYCFIDVNPTFEQQTGIIGAAGRWMRQIAPQHEQHWFDIYGRIAQTGEEQRFEAPAQALGRHYDVFAFRVGDPKDHLVGILFKDITERKQAERLLQQSETRYRQLAGELEERVQQRTHDLSLANQDLQRSNDNLQQFAYVASHDLQEPLRKIQSFSSLLEQQLGTQLDETGRSYLQRIGAAGARMSTLLRDLLAYSRIATRQQVFGPISLQAVLTDVLSTLDWQIEQTGTQISLEELPIVNGDESQLSQLFQNLLTNAIKFVRPNQFPQIDIQYFHRSVAELPPEVHPSARTPFYHQISVHDSGIGFDNKFRDRLFGVFQRLHGKNDFPGTGVGLAIARRVVENHGGAITADGKPGEGATFFVYLPA